MVFIGKYNKSVILTYIGITLAVCGIIFSFLGNISNAMICLIFSGICDLFDGKMARLCKRDEQEKEFGKQIDSLADVFLFLALPCVLGVELLKALPLYFNIVFVIYVICGVIRLAWFNILASSDQQVKYFIGMPVAYIALVLPIIYSVGLIFKFNLSLVYFFIYLLFAILFIINVKVSKPKGIWYIIFFILAIIVTIAIKMVG